MAPLKNIVLAASLLAPLTLAVPLVDKRAIYTHTHTEIVMVTVEETTTIWVNPAEATPPPAAVSQTETVAAVPSSASASASGAVFAQSDSVPSTFATEVATTSSYIPATVENAVVETTVPAPAPASSSSAAPVSSPSVNVEAKDLTASTSASCEGTGNACVGDVTHWDGGLGACGWTVDTSSQYAIALPYAFMGTQSNGNPYCGRSVTLVNPTSGTTVTATVGDKCMGCVDRSIDCTDALFNAITDGQGDGRLSGIQWYFS